MYSTATGDMEYVEWAPRVKGEGGPNVKVHKVIIRGGANRIDRHHRTAKGVMTCVSNEDMEMLKANSNFKRHVEKGYMVVLDKDVSADKVAKDMAPKDGSAQLVEADFDKGRAPKAAKPKVA